MPTVAPYGSWASPFTAKAVANGNPRFNFTACHNDNIYWVESRPWEAGRNVVVERRPNGETRDLTPEGFSASSSVHEYGGTPFYPTDDSLVFINAADQRLYQVNLESLIVTALSNNYQTQDEEYRFADFSRSAAPNHLLAVCEIHRANQQPENLIVDLCLTSGKLTRLCTGSDFYAYPRLSPNNQQLCWLSWNHPDMPWDENQLWLADISIKNTDEMSLDNTRALVANKDEAIFQPSWADDGKLLFVSDRSNWWNLYQHDLNNAIKPLHPIKAECATPLWSLGMSTYAADNQGRLFFTYTQNGCWYLGKLTADAFEVIPLPFTDIFSLSISLNKLIFVAASPVTPQGVIALNIDNPNVFNCISAARSAAIGDNFISQPEAFEFPTDNGDTSYGYFYPAKNNNYVPPANQLPPLIVICHGGPTGATSSAYNPKIQFWTSRGFAVADINYRGSTGFGRNYREKLNGLWGQADVVDTINAVNYLSKEGRIDGGKTIIRGSSAGGYTVLAALCFHNCFKAGASLYGIGDLETLARDTHKFESRYLDKLIGPYPQQRDKYQQLSPCYHAEQLNCPVIFFQGLLDKVVPPQQAEKMIEKLQANGQTTRYITFADEGHGFKKADNIETSLREELAFYAAVFDFDLGNL